MGYTTVTCRNEGCGYTYKTDYTKPLEHNYMPEVTPAGCTEGGYTTFTCERCADSYVADYTEATGHKWDNGKTVTQSVCNNDGMTEYRCKTVTKCVWRRSPLLAIRQAKMPTVWSRRSAPNVVQSSIKQPAINFKRK